MEAMSSTAPSNIVAVAMSNANLNLPPASPKAAHATIAIDSSPHPPQVQMVGSPVLQRVASPQKMANAESMEVTEQTSTSNRSLPRQRSQESEVAIQRSVESSHPVTPSSFRAEDGDEQVVMRTDGKAPHLVTVTPPANHYPVISVNSDIRLQQIVGSSDKRLMTPSPVGLQFLNKTDTADNEPRTVPKEDTTYPITCGNNKAELVWRKFICPGINAKCVKCGDNWYTPKEFVNFAGKSTLKDWKRAIRIKGIMLRKMIDNGGLNYYEHETNCSNQCRSNKSASFDNSCEKSTNSFESIENKEMSREHSFDCISVRSSSEDLPHLASKKLASLHVRSQESTSSIQGSQSLERSSSEDSGLAASPHLDGMLLREAPVTVEKIQDLNNFWNGILRMDLFDDIIRDVMIQVTNLQSRTRNNGAISIEDVVTMTNLVNSLEMIPSISNKMTLHKKRMEKETEESSHTIQELEKRLAEQRKFEQDLKRKSQHLENVISLTPTEKRQKRIYRIGRQKAVESRIPPVAGSPVPGTVRENVMMGAMPARTGLGQRELWPQTIQAASSQMARMNVSGTTGQSAMPIPSFAIFSPNIHNNPDMFATSSLQAFMTSSHHPSRDSTQSPKK